MQKIFNAIAVASGVVSLTVVGAGLGIYLNKDAIINHVKEKALESITGSLGDTLGDSLPIPDVTGDVIPKGTGPINPF
ncbi:MAG: hypothetical protein CM15mV37_0950 [uncultured marine virus]|nr:MAG: hypothetical protein CM15mV37_0950 [uncultured marine virus]